MGPTFFTTIFDNGEVGTASMGLGHSALRAFFAIPGATNIGSTWYAGGGTVLWQLWGLCPNLFASGAYSHTFPLAGKRDLFLMGYADVGFMLLNYGYYDADANDYVSVWRPKMDGQLGCNALFMPRGKGFYYGVGLSFYIEGYVTGDKTVQTDVVLSALLGRKF